MSTTGQLLHPSMQPPAASAAAPPLAGTPQQGTSRDPYPLKIQQPPQPPLASSMQQHIPPEAGMHPERLGMGGVGGSFSKGTGHGFGAGVLSSGFELGKGGHSQSFSSGSGRQPYEVRTSECVCIRTLNTCTHMYVCLTCTRTNTHMCIFTRIHNFLQSHSRMPLSYLTSYACRITQSSHTLIHTHACAYTHITQSAHTHSYTHTRMCIHTYNTKCTHSYTHTHAHTHIQHKMHTLIQTRMRIHIYIGTP